MSKDSCTVLAVGDIMPFRDEPDTMFDHVRSTLSDADICYGMMIASHSDQGARSSTSRSDPGQWWSGARGVVPKDVRMLPSIASAGFDVVSLASNHAMDWGAVAMLDCISRLDALGVRVIGAGPNLQASRVPAVFEVRRVRIAFLSYCSVAPKAYYARAEDPGVAPMRAVTHYEPFEDDQPGTPPRVMTFPVARDLDALCEDISRAKETADVVILGMHWGVHSQSRIADYEQTVAHAAIDAGADLIVGHHTHLAKCIEVYRDKVIFYGLGDFALEAGPNRHRLTGTGNQEYAREYAKVFGVKDPLAGHGHQYAMIAQCTITAEGVENVGFIPVVHEPGGEPMPVAPSSEAGKEVVRHIEAVAAEAELATRFVDDGRMMVVWTRDS